MGYAKILGGGADGRYTIELDFGQHIKDEILAALSIALSNLETQLSQAQEKLDERIDAENAIRDYIASIVQAIVDKQNEPPPANRPTPEMLKAIDDAKKRMFEARKLTLPARIKVDQIKGAIDQTKRNIVYWNAFAPKSTRQAWCLDYTTDKAAGTQVATVEIPGEPELMLIAPGGRGFRYGDGLISTARKTQILAALNARLTKLTARLSDLGSKITAGTAAEAGLVAELADARARYAAEKTSTNQKLVDQASFKLTAKRRELADLNVKLQATLREHGEVTARISAESARPSTDTPNAGDGVLTARELMSPQQAFFNSAILPGWQKHMPTYRWGTVLSIDETAETMNVELAEAFSSAQRLPINKKTILTNVPTRYMECNVAAFAVGDRCVVQFEGQSWDSPKVIGFLDNPKPCTWVLRSSLGVWECMDPEVMDEIRAGLGSISVEVRLNGGAWQECPLWVSNSSYYLYRKYETDPLNAYYERNSILVIKHTYPPATTPWAEAATWIRAMHDYQTSLSGDWTPTMAEFVVRLGGTIIFNAAVSNVGGTVYGSPPDSNTLFVRAKAGISLYGDQDPRATAGVVRKAYTLLTDT